MQPLLSRRMLSTELSLQRLGRLSLGTSRSIASAVVNAGSSDLGYAWARLCSVLAADDDIHVESGDVTADQLAQSVVRVSPSSVMLSDSSLLRDALIRLSDSMARSISGYDASIRSATTVGGETAAQSQAVRNALVAALRGFGPFGARVAGSPQWADVSTAISPHPGSVAESANVTGLVALMEVSLPAHCPPERVIECLCLFHLQSAEGAISPNTPAFPPTTSAVDWLRRRRVRGLIQSTSVPALSVSVLSEHARAWSSASAISAAQARRVSPSYHAYAARLGPGGMAGDGYHTAPVRKCRVSLYYIA